jgi:ribonuclease HI
MTTTPTLLRIKTLNCRKQPEVLKSLLNTTTPLEWDALCLQEVPASIAKLASFRTTSWHLILPPHDPTDANAPPIRSAIYLNRNINSAQYQQVSVPSPDITAVRFTSPTSTCTLFSVYSPPTSLATIHTLRTHLETYSHDDSLILTGDFNQHHPIWSGTNNSQRTQHSSTQIPPFIQLLAEFNLDQCLPAGTPTFFSDAHKTWSTIDLVFVTPDLSNAVTICTTDSGHGSDHRCINTHIDFTLQRQEALSRFNWREVDWGKFNETLTQLINAKSLLDQSYNLTSPAQIDTFVDELLACYHHTATSHVPLSRPSPFMKRWWTQELTQLHLQFKSAQNRASKRNSTLAERLVAKRAGQEYHKAIQRQQRRHWKEWIKNATAASVYKAWSCVSQHPDSISSTRIPELKTTGGVANTSQAKCDALHSQFFPPPPPAELDDTDNFSYPEPLACPPVTEDETTQAIHELSPYKAPGPSGIPNVALQKTANTLSPILTAITNAALRLNHHPSSWKFFTTITLRKPGKPDYTIPKAYRPIALEDTMSKVTESVIARRLTQLAEEHHLLPPNHFGARPGKTTTDAALYLAQWIKDKWRQGSVTSVLFLDISQAFPSVSHTRLLHNLRKRRVPENIIAWCRSFLSNRTTKLTFDDHNSEPLHASTGLPQGSPLSPILYLFYSADLLEIIPPNDSSHLAGGFVDDTMLAVSSNSIEMNVAMLQPLIENSLTWSRRHSCHFDIGKFQLVHFTRNRRKYSPTPITIGGHIVPAVDSARYLGLIFDKELRWRPQAEQAIAKGTSAVLAVARLARPAIGMPHRYVRQLYQTVVQPRMEYGLVVWYQPVLANPTGRCKKGSVGIARRLGKVQNLAARQIVGGLHSTPIDILNYHANLTPIELHLNKSVAIATARLNSLPPSHPLHKTVRRCARSYPRRHRGPLHELQAAFTNLTRLETINPTPTHPAWTPRFSFHIAPDKEAAERDVVKYHNDFCIFTDGSGIENRIGAAAFSEGRDGQARTRQFTLGPDSEHTVFEGELVGTILALDIILAEPRLRTATILLDSQPAIKALHANRPQPGQQLIQLFHKQLKKLLQLRRSFQLRLVWVPGHRGVPGNEHADELAKQAAAGQSTPLHFPLKLLDKLPTSLSAVKMQLKRDTADSWTQQWKESKHGQRIQQFDPTPPGRRVQRIYQGLSRPAGSLLTQLRSGHVGLNPYLARIRLVDSPLCPHCTTLETVEHYLLGCRKYTHERHQLRIAIGRRQGHLDRRSLLATPKHFKALLTYIGTTRRFNTYADEF